MPSDWPERAARRWAGKLHTRHSFPLFSLKMLVLTSPQPRKPDCKTYLTVNTDAIIIVSPLVWKKRNSDREGQARDKAVLLGEKGLWLGQAPVHSERRIWGQPSTHRPRVTENHGPTRNSMREGPPTQRRLPFSHT